MIFSRMMSKKNSREGFWFSISGGLWFGDCQYGQ
jgi:hypothetical protein